MPYGNTTEASQLPQADASTLVDRADLERQVQEVYRRVAGDPLATRHFETGRRLALRLGVESTTFVATREDRRQP